MSGDPYWDKVDLYVPFNGTDGSTSATDLSTYANTLTAAGNAHISTAQSKFGGSSAIFDGSGDYFSVANNEVGDFYSYGGGTFECWIYPTSLATQFIIFQTYTDTGSSNGFIFHIGTDGKVILYAREYLVINAAAGAVVTNAWQHIALGITAGGAAGIYVDGNLKGSGTFSSSAGYNNADRTYIGGNIYGASATGYISHVRRTRGIVRYTSDFTPPSAAFDTFGATLLSTAIQRPLVQAFNPLIFHY